MNVQVSHLWRHPIKGYGAEAIASAMLNAGETMPWDRLWAVGHDAARPEARDGTWARCLNFCRGARSPALMAIRARTDTASGAISLEHPNAPPLQVDLSLPSDVERFLTWAQALADSDRGRPAFVVRARDQGMTDTEFPSVSILNHASLQALSVAAGHDLDMRRFRGNIWLTGIAAWREFDLPGREIRVGGTVIGVRKPITRCRATTANPETGVVDVDTLAVLRDRWGHQDFGVYGEVLSGGQVSVGDTVQLG